MDGVGGDIENMFNDDASGVGDIVDPTLYEASHMAVNDFKHYYSLLMLLSRKYGRYSRSSVGWARTL